MSQEPRGRISDQCATSGGAARAPPSHVILDFRRPSARPYGFGEVRFGPLALLTFTALSG
jgi:hypothetical protein